MKKRQKRFSLDWSLLAASAIFFLLGNFIAPRYESMFREAGIFEEIVPVSKYAMIIAGVLAACFLILLVIRIVLLMRR